jgi:hypothetical protein
MKITASRNGKRKIKISKKEWESIGKTAGWLKTARLQMKEGKPGDDGYWHMPQPEVKPASRKDKNAFERGESCTVIYPISQRYNGGIIINNEWYEGFKVPPPIVPDGYKLVNIGIGDQLNATPPHATMYLKREE